MPTDCQPRAAECQGALQASAFTRVFERARLVGAGDPSSWMRAPLEIRLLGPFEVVAGGTLAEVGGSKRQALLAMLALRQGRVVDVDALV